MYPSVQFIERFGAVEAVGADWLPGLDTSDPGCRNYRDIEECLEDVRRLCPDDVSFVERLLMMSPYRPQEV